jgi:hypothetical protein
MEPSELHRHFRVREIATGRELWLMNGDVRYKATGDGWGDYRPAPDGEYFLAEIELCSHRGALWRPEDVEPLPDGRGLWSPASWEHWSKMAITYEGSFRQAAGLSPYCTTCGGHASEHPYPGSHVFVAA